MYTTYLKQHFNEFNLITLAKEQAIINIKLNKLFSKFEKYKFLPAEYKEFLNAYVEYPNYFIKICNHHEVSINYYNNILNENIKNRYELFYREIWNVFTKIKISVVCEQHGTKFLYFVVKNFVHNQELNILYACSLQQAFATFMQYN